MSASVAFILKGYPRLSESFIAQEIYGLEQAGMAIRIYAMRHPTDQRRHPVHAAIKAPIVYLPEYLHDEPLRVLRALGRVRHLPGFSAAFTAFAQDLRLDLSPNRFRRFGQAAVLVDELAGDVVHLHAHFIHTPASVVRYAGLMTGRSWTCSAHAKDIWTSKPWELRQKLHAAQWAVTCTKVGQEALKALADEPDKVHLAYHGLDLARFHRKSGEGSRADGTDPRQPVRLLAVGRAVPKKGFDILLKALALLPQDCHWHFTHIGGGDELKRLKAEADRSGLSQKMAWLGARDQLDVLAAYRDADFFVLPSLIAGDGDRDGLPNVLMEAQSQGLACLSTTVSGIPELISDGKTGVLVQPGDIAALSAALASLIADPERRRALGEAGERQVRHHFDHKVGLLNLLRLFRAVGVPLEKE